MRYPSVEELLPHEKGMLLIDALDAYQEGVATTSLTLRPGAFYMRGSVLDELWTIEILAQGAAVLYGFECMKKEAPRRFGYLIAIDELLVELADPIAAGETLTVTARLEKDLYPIGLYATELLHRGRRVISARMKFFADERQEAMA